MNGSMDTTLNQNKSAFINMKIRQLPTGGLKINLYEIGKKKVK